MKNNILKLTNIRILICLYCLLALFTSILIYAAVKIDSITYQQSSNYDNHLRYHIAHSYFRQGTDILTDAVRRYVVTADPKYMEDYFRESREVKHRERALEMVKDLDIDQPLKSSLYNAMKTSKALMHTEYHAMHLIDLENHKELFHDQSGKCLLTRREKAMSPAQRHELAEKLLWDDEYIKTKNRIYSYLADGIEKSSRQAEVRNQQLNKELIRMMILSAVSLIALVLTICGFFFYRRYQHERMIEMQAEENARMNARLKEERDKSIQAEKAKSYFFSSVSHDIRTPLNSIIGFSEMLQLGIDNPEEKKKALDAIITSGNTLLELINDVLDLSKLESGKMELRPVPTDIAALVAKVATSFEAATSKRSIRLKIEVEKMPFLLLDPLRIRQVLFNLIGNAVKFTEQGSITVRASFTGSTLMISVTDTGCGISREDIGKLMSPYVQLQEHDSTKGTGLGLAICKQLAKQMKGTLHIESTLGKGSTFTLRIPKVKTFSEKESEAYFKEHNVPKAEVHLDETAKSSRILVADDQKLNLRIMQTMLSRLGFHDILMVENGEEALAALNDSGQVDLVLTDMSMPVMDGAALVREIRNLPRFAKLPVCVITADVEMLNKYREIGFDDMIIKPVKLDKLKELLVKYSSLRPDTTADGNGVKA